MDIKSKEERSANMSRIKSKNTKPEIYIRSILYKKGMRYRVNYKHIGGKPDLFFIKDKTAIFIHGCYWHQHPGCKYAYKPKSNVEFWEKKLEGNKKRDEQVSSELLLQGIKVLILWECTIKKMQRDTEYEQMVVELMQEFIKKGTLGSLSF